MKEASRVLVVVTLALLAVALSTSAFPQQAQKPLANADVIVSESVVVATIQGTTHNFLRSSV